MRPKALLTIACFALMGAVAVAQNVTYDFDRTADFARFRTYAWVRGHNLGDELNHQRIVRAVDVQLGAKGLSQVATDANPDVLVAYHAAFDRSLQITGFSGWGYRVGAGRSGSARADEIVVGTLVVEMVNATTQAIVWRGIATKDLKLNASPEKRERSINKATEKLFANYPPQH